MLAKALSASNAAFIAQAKPDIVYEDDEIEAKLCGLFRKLVRALVGRHPVFLSTKRVACLPVHPRSLEYVYPDSEFIKKCTTKHVIVSQLSKMRLFLVVLKELTNFRTHRNRKREIFYRNTACFDNQAALDEVLKQFMFTLRIRRSQLNVFNAPKGLVFGPVVIGCEEGSVRLNNPVHQRTGNLIGVEDFVVEWSQAAFVLVVEKETVFSALMSQDFSRRFPEGVILTGKGYPDFTTKRFLKRLVHCLPGCPVLYLGDLDPHGIEILLNYLFSTPLTVYENSSVTSIFPIGLDAADAQQMGLGRGIQATSEDLVKAGNLLALPFFQMGLDSPFPTDFEWTMRLKLAMLRTNLELVREHVVKFEVEQVEAAGVALIDFVTAKINRIFS